MPPMTEPPINVELTRSELHVLQAALHAYLDDFGHDEAELLRELKVLAAKLAAYADHDLGPSEQSFVTEL